MAQGQLRSLMIFLMKLECKERNLFKKNRLSVVPAGGFFVPQKKTILHFILQINVVKGGFFYGDTGKGL